MVAGMIPFCVTRFAPLVVAVGLAVAPAAADDEVRQGERPGTIIVPAPQAGEAYKVVPPSPPGVDGPPPGLYRRVTPPRDGENPQQYMPAAPSRPDEGRRDEGLERAREAARAARPAPPQERPSERPSGDACLSAKDARGAIRAKRAVTLAQAARAAREAWDGEVIDYKLCNVQGLLTYDLTLLNSDGKVARARIDAGSGKLVNVK